MLVRETLVIHSRLSWRQVRGVAAIERKHGLQALAIEHVAARLAGGFLQPINPDSLKEAIGEAIAMDLGEFNFIKTLPGFPRAAAATLEKAWAAGLKFSELAKTSDALVRSRIDAVARLEAQVLKRLPPSMRRPADSSIWGQRRLGGKPHPLGSGDAWNNTVANLERVLAARNHTFLYLDEAHLARPQDIVAAIFLISEGQGRGRYNEKRRWQWFVPVFSTSNPSVAEILAKAREPVGGFVPQGCR
jgi:hypothetical protein